MYGIIVLAECLFEEITPKSVELCETFSYQAEEFGVCLFLTTTLDDHGRKLRFLACRKLDFHQLMASLLKIKTGHYGQVDCTSQVDEVSVGLIFDLNLLLLLGLVVVRGHFRARPIVILVAAVFAQNFCFQPLVCLLMGLPLRIVLENVETVFDLNITIDVHLMCDLIFLFNQIQLLFNGGIVLVPIFADLKQNLNHVLCSFVNVGFVEDASEVVKNKERNRLAHFLQVLANFSGEADGDLDRVVRRFMKK